jgi:hypothetical protein
MRARLTAAVLVLAMGSSSLAVAICEIDCAHELGQTAENSSQAGMISSMLLRSNDGPPTSPLRN